ncbi:MAG: nitroreductase family protein [Anaerolineae bacterium]|nr:nitroreductase family protein [Anaerolineae bacterium]
MSFFELIQKRYSVRAYKPDPVEEEKLQQILEAAQLAPTAANRQPFRVFVLKTADHKAELQRIYGRDWFVDAPWVIGVCGMPGAAWTRRSDEKCYVDVDAAIVMDHIVLAATELGLGTCWIGAFDPDAAREVLGLPDDVEPIVFTPLGYPADEAKPKKRQSLDELVKYEHW